jgi:hypothetical protein
MKTSLSFEIALSLNIKERDENIMFSLLWGKWSNNHPKEDVAKFGYLKKNQFFWNM